MLCAEKDIHLEKGIPVEWKQYYQKKKASAGGFLAFLQLQWCNQVHVSKGGKRHTELITLDQ